ncbi:MAG: hypothetical protein NC408_05965 [Candidatus Gastranaerophilales bacterium]|nr:hypothetical protein [Candidatus Gastranaerophilales bacterium]MCM1072418.1 hypothetical protein [Bacteroides sp.]
MLVQKINFNSNLNYTNKVSFKSNREHEAMLRALRLAQAEELKQRFAKLQELHDYQIQDQGCHNMAQFILNFACAIENDSEHSLDEFFKSEVEAARIRRGLSPECQRNSLEIREEIQSQPVFKDPALTLITAKDMKDFVPVDEEFAQNEQYQTTINAAKKSITDAIEAADKSKFDSTEIGLIKELTQIIKQTKGLDFGTEYDNLLERLLDSIKRRKRAMTQTAIQQKNIIPKIRKMLKH